MNALPRHPLWLLARCALQRATPGAALPVEASRWAAPPVDPRALRAFNRLLGFGSDVLPLSFHYLALQRAQLDWMARPGFPYRLLGMVHMAQSLTRLAPWQREAGYEVQLRAQAEGKRNLRLCAEFVQGDRPVLRAESLYRPPREPGSRPLREPAPEAPPAEPPLAQWDLPSGAGRAYAWVSGDFNPIHLSAWSARLFGLRTPLIHGMHTLARSEAVLCPKGAQTADIKFLRPLALPGSAQLHPDGAGHAVWGPAGRSATLTISG